MKRKDLLFTALFLLLLHHILQRFHQIKKEIRVFFSFSNNCEIGQSQSIDLHLFSINQSFTLISLQYQRTFLSFTSRVRHPHPLPMTNQLNRLENNSKKKTEVNHVDLNLNLNLNVDVDVDVGMNESDIYIDG